MALGGPRPQWLTFDCYGTLIQWDEGLLSAVGRILERASARMDAARFIEVYDRHEHALEQERPHRTFADVSAQALSRAMAELSLPADETAGEILTSSIGKMPPFPEVASTLGRLKAAGFRLAVISNTDDAIIAGNMAQLGGHVERLITAQQARAYKPSSQIFHHAWRELGTDRDHLLHICASPHLDLVAARDLGFRSIWVDRGTERRPLADYSSDATVPTLDAIPPLLAAAGWL